MIAAQKSRWFHRWFAGHATAALRRHFTFVRVAGLEHLERALQDGPVVVVANHQAYWDALVILALSRRLDADAFAMMDAENLRRLPFFAKVGAFGVDLDDPSDGARALRYSAKLLRTPGRLLFVFPQGEERPAHEPLVFREGAAALARMAKRAVVMPLAMRYAHGSDERPELWLSIGAPVTEAREPAMMRVAQQDAVQRELDRIDAARSEPKTRGAPFAVWLATGPSWLGRLAERALAWLCRGVLRHDSGPPKVSARASEVRGDRSTI